MKNEPFVLNKRIKSFAHAFRGIKAFIIKEHNARIHAAAIIVVILLAIFLKVDKLEIILLLFVTGLVWICEMINSAIEKMMDFITTEKLPQIKFIKDVSAGAVLIAAIIALTTGCLIFIPKL